MSAAACRSEDLQECIARSGVAHDCYPHSRDATRLSALYLSSLPPLAADVLKNLKFSTVP